MRGAAWTLDRNSWVRARSACIQCMVRCHQLHRVWSHDCFEACPKCTSACNADSKMPFFFKYVNASMESTYDKSAMEVPPEFAKAHMLDTMCHAELEGPNNQLWIIKLEHGPTMCRLGEGWKEFAATHKLAQGDALLFQLNASSARRKIHLLVKIFKQKPFLQGLAALKLHEDKRLKLSTGIIHKTVHVEKTAADKPGERIQDINSLGLPIVLAEVQEEELPNSNALNPCVANMECNGSDPYWPLRIDVKGKEENGKTATQKCESSINSQEKRQCSEGHYPFVSALHRDKECLNPKARMFGPSVEEAHHIEVKAFMPGEENREETLNAHQHNETCGEYQSGIDSLRKEPITQEEEQNTNSGEGIGRLKQVAVFSEPVPQEEEQNNKSIEGIACSQQVAIKKDGKRKTAMRAMAKIASFYSAKSVTCDIMKPISTFSENLDIEKKAKTQSLLKENNVKTDACKSEGSLRANDTLRSTCQGAYVLAIDDSVPISFLKRIQPSHVNFPFGLRIPSSFSHTFLKAQYKPEGRFIFRLMMESTCSGVDESIPSAMKQWSVHCICSRGAMIFSKGWREFATSNELKVGDACMFKLVKPFVFTIQILHDDSSKIHAEASKEQLSLLAIPACIAVDPMKRMI